MNWEAWLTLVVITLVLYGLARNLAGPDVILLGAAVVLTTLSLASDRFPSPRELAASFGNEAMLTVGVLFVVVAGLTETGAMTAITERFLGRPKSVSDAQVRMMVPVVATSAFLNNTPVVAMFMPVLDDWTRKLGLSASKLYIPLSYAAVLGGCCTLIGTSTNLVVHGLMLQAQRDDPSMPTMGLFTLSGVAVPAAIAGIAFLLLFSRLLLPDRQSFRSQASDAREYTVEMMVTPGSPLDGQTIEQAGLRHLGGMYLSTIERDGERLVAVGPEQALRADDRLEFVGVVDSVVDLKRIRGLMAAPDQVRKLNAADHSRRLVEAVVSDTCPIVGKTIRDGAFRTRYDAVVIAVYRNGERINGKIGDIILKAGDALLLEAHPRFLNRHRNSRDFLLVSPVADSHPRRHERAGVALAILAGLVAVASAEDFTGIGIFHAALIAAGLMGITRCCSAEQARRSIDFPVLVSIAAALTVGRAMQSSGLAGAMADRLVAVSSGAGPWGVLAAIYVLTLLFTEILTNNAAAALAFPVAHAAATGLGVNFMPFAVVICMAASGGFATPLGYQTHMMVYGPGGYRFSDFLRVGIPMDLIVMATTLAITPLVFSF